MGVGVGVGVGIEKLSWSRMYHSVELVWNIVSQCVSIVSTASV